MLNKLSIATALIASIVSVMATLPAFAEDEGNAFPSRPAVTLAQFDLCIGADCQRSYRELRYYDGYYGRYDDDWRYWYDDDWRYRQSDDWRYQRGDHCWDVTVREWRGDDVVVRRERRCD